MESAVLDQVKRKQESHLLLLESNMRFSVRCHGEYLRKLVENTSGGLDRIVLIRNEERFRLFLWCSTYVLLTVCMVALCFRSIAAYSVFPTVSSIDIRENRLSVPSIALCSMNPFKRDILCEGQFSSLCSPSTSFADEFAKFSAGSENGNTSDVFMEHYTRAFYELDDLVVSCWLRGEPCKSSGAEFFTPVIIQVHLYGRCYCVFCGNGRKYGEVLRNQTDDPSNGLVLMLNSSIKDYMPHTEGLGFILLFYTYRKDAAINRDAVHASIGETTFMRLEASKSELLPAPYPSRCGSFWPADYADIEGIVEEKYSHSNCVNICLGRQLIKECNCERTSQFPDLSSLDRVCRRSRQEIRCRTETLSNPKRLRVNCKCAPECAMNVYSVRVSRAGFQKSVTKAPDNVTKVIVYQGISETTLIRETAKYRFAEMVGAIGSSMNAFTGLSFLLMYEAIDVLATWILHIKNVKIETD